MTFDRNQASSIELTLSADASLLLLPALAPPSPRLISSEYDDFNKRTEILNEDLIDEDFTSSCYEETFEFGAASNYSHFIFPSSSFGNYAPPPTSPVNLTDSVSAANTTSSSSSISSASSISHLPDVDEGSESAVAVPTTGKRKRTTMPKGTKPGRERSNETERIRARLVASYFTKIDSLGYFEPLPGNKKRTKTQILDAAIEFIDKASEDIRRMSQLILEQASDKLLQGQEAVSTSSDTEAPLLQNRGAFFEHEIAALLPITSMPLVAESSYLEPLPDVAKWEIQAVSDVRLTLRAPDQII